MGFVRQRPVLSGAYLSRGRGPRRRRDWRGPGAAIVALLALALLILLPSGRTPRPDREPEAVAASSDSTGFPDIAILCYHHVSDDPNADGFTVSADTLRAQIRRARENGWTFVPLARVLAARDDPRSLPARTMVITFDDGYRSFVNAALPVLRDEGVPATIAIVNDFVEHPPDGMPSIVTWKQVAELDRADDVQVLSHSHGLHQWIRQNPQGNTWPSTTTRRWDHHEDRYEHRSEYEERVRRDMRLARQVLASKIGHAVDVYVWPYGEYNAFSQAAAREAGFTTTLALGDRFVTAEDLEAGALPRFLVQRGHPIGAEDERWVHLSRPAVRLAQADLDEVWSEDREAFDRNLDALIEQVKRIGANTVVLPACHDPNGDGFLRQTWFKNHQADIRADVLGFVVARFKIAGLRVWVRAPSINLTWEWERHPEWRIPFKGSRRGMTPWYFRVSPDLPEVREAARDFFADLAVYVPFDGILFDDDAYMLPGERLAGGDRSQDAKVEAVREHLEVIKDVVRHWRPQATFARNLYAPVVERNGIHKTFAQDLDESLRHDDLSVVMAYPWMEGHGDKPDQWVGKLARTAVSRWKRVAAKAPPERRALRFVPVVFKFQAYDWDEEGWIERGTLLDMAHLARRYGIEHLGVYPVIPGHGELANDLLLGPAEAPVYGRAGEKALATSP